MLGAFRAPSDNGPRTNHLLKPNVINCPGLPTPLRKLLFHASATTGVRSGRDVTLPSRILQCLHQLDLYYFPESYYHLKIANYPFKRYFPLELSLIQFKVV